MIAEERFNKTLVALSVEISEIANCSEHFKFWKDNKGKVDEELFLDSYSSSGRKDGMYYDKNNKKLGLTRQQAHKLTLVEECSDALHFILSLANQLQTELGGFNLVPTNSSLETTYLMIQLNISCMGTLDSKNSHVETLSVIFDWFYHYISKLGVTTAELEQAYYDKNEINYKRLREGY